MERLVKDEISILYYEDIWRKKKTTPKAAICSALIGIITALMLFAFVYIVLGNANKQMNITYAIIVVVLEIVLTGLVEKLIYRKNLQVYKLVNWINNLNEVELLYENNKVIVRHKNKLGFNVNSKLDTVLRRLGCKYSIHYVKGDNGKKAALHIDTITSSKYIRIDAVIK